MLGRIAVSRRLAFSYLKPASEYQAAGHEAQAVQRATPIHRVMMCRAASGECRTSRCPGGPWPFRAVLLGKAQSSVRHSQS
jgi:hypothetical protein